MFDSHCHLNISPLKKDVVGIIKDAREKGVEYFLIPGINIETSKDSINISSNFENVYSSCGIHPTENLDSIDFEKAFQDIEELIDNNEKIVAVGECGLDYYKYKSSINAQKKYFEKHINIAIKKDLPLIIHNRMATEDLIDILNKRYQNILEYKIVLHCSPVDKALIDFAIERKAYIGVCGDVTYDKEKQMFIKNIPTDLLLLETDSPYLTPEPEKSKKRFPNTPSNLCFIADKISEIKGVKKEEVERITTKNAIKLFDIM